MPSLDMTLAKRSSTSFSSPDQIDQNIPTKNYVKRSERREIRNEIEAAEFDLGTNFRSDPPKVGGLREILNQKLNRQAALHLGLAVKASPRPIQYLG